MTKEYPGGSEKGHNSKFVRRLPKKSKKIKR